MSLFFRYRSVSYSSSYSQLVYTQVSTCCSGYTGSPQTAAGCQGWYTDLELLYIIAQSAV